MPGERPAHLQVARIIGLVKMNGRAGAKCVIQSPILAFLQRELDPSAKGELLGFNGHWRPRKALRFANAEALLFEHCGQPTLLLPLLCNQRVGQLPKFFDRAVHAQRTSVKEPLMYLKPSPGRWFGH